MMLGLYKMFGPRVLEDHHMHLVLEKGQLADVYSLELEAPTYGNYLCTLEMKHL